jgi:hypothetical protein
VVSVKNPYGRILGFLDRSRYYCFKVASQLYSRDWVDPVPAPLLLRKSASAGNRTRNLWICSHELWPLDYRDGLGSLNISWKRSQYSWQKFTHALPLSTHWPSLAKNSLSINSDGFLSVRTTIRERPENHCKAMRTLTEVSKNGFQECFQKTLRSLAKFCHWPREPFWT